MISRNGSELARIPTNESTLALTNILLATLAAPYGVPKHYFELSRQFATTSRVTQYSASHVGANVRVARAMFLYRSLDLLVCFQWESVLGRSSK